MRIYKLSYIESFSSSEKKKVFQDMKEIKQFSYIKRSDSDYFREISYRILSSSFIKKYAGNLDWEIISSRIVPLPWKEQLQLLDEYSDKISWRQLNYKNFSSRYIRKYKNRICWEKLLITRKCSEGLLQEYLSFFNQNCWDNLCQYQNMSEAFLSRYKNKINWEIVSKYQNFSLPFVKKNIKKLSLTYIKKNKKITHKDVVKIKQLYIKYKIV